MAQAPDPVMLRFRSALDAAFGARIERVVLFGSRARGDHRSDSDYDVAVFLRDKIDFGRESSLLSDIEIEIEIDTGSTINALPLRAGAHEERTIFMAEVRRDGVVL